MDKKEKPKLTKRQRVINISRIHNSHAGIDYEYIEELCHKDSDILNEYKDTFDCEKFDD